MMVQRAVSDEAEDENEVEVEVEVLQWVDDERESRL